MGVSHKNEYIIHVCGCVPHKWKGVSYIQMDMSQVSVGVSYTMWEGPTWLVLLSSNSCGLVLTAVLTKSRADP